MQQEDERQQAEAETEMVLTEHKESFVTIKRVSELMWIPEQCYHLVADPT